MLSSAYRRSETIMKPQHIGITEELKNKVGRDFFARFDYVEKMGKIDFAVKNMKTTGQSSEQLPLPKVVGF